MHVERALHRLQLSDIDKSSEFLSQICIRELLTRNNLSALDSIGFGTTMKITHMKIVLLLLMRLFLRANYKPYVAPKHHTNIKLLAPHASCASPKVISSSLTPVLILTTMFSR